MQNKSVDDVWKELNAKTAPRARSSGIPGFGIPGVASSARILPSKPAVKLAAGSAQPITTIDAPYVGCTNQTYDPQQAGVSQQDLQAYVSSIQRLINCLTDQDRSSRRSAIKSLQSKLLVGDAATPKASPGMLQALLCGPLLGPLPAMLSDPVEACRTAACAVLSEAAPQLPEPAALLPVLVPRLVSRIGSLPVSEPSEELRLALLQLVVALVRRAGTKALAPYAGELCQLLGRCLDDSYGEVVKATAGGVEAAAAALPPGALEAHSDKLLQALLAQLPHPHRQVRQALVAALQGLVLAGLPPGSVERLVGPGGVGLLLEDRSPAVREAALRMLGTWLGAGGSSSSSSSSSNGCQDPSQQQQQQQQPHSSSESQAAATSGVAVGVMGGAERCQVYAPHLLPLLLLGVTDPEPSLSALSLQLVEEVGRVWAGGAPSQQLEGAAAAAGLAGHDRGAAAAAAATGDGPEPMDTGDSPTAAASQQQQEQRAVAAALLPAPFAGLPGEGCRLMGAALLPGLLPRLVRELGEWTSRVRAGAARCLHVLLVLAGRAATPQLPLLLPSLAGAVADDDLSVVSHISGAARILGAFTPPAAWLPIAMDGLGEGAKVAASRRANMLVITGGLLEAAAAAGYAPDAPLLHSLVRVLSGEEVRGSDHVGVQMQLLVVVQRVVAWGGALVAPVGQLLYCCLLQLWGSPQVAAVNKDWSNLVEAALDQLAGACGCSGRDALAQQYALTVLPELTASASTWTGSSPAVQAFQALLRTAGPEGLTTLVPSVVPVLAQCCGDHERDGTLRLELLRLVDDLVEDAGKGAAMEGPAAALLLREVLLPPLVWRAGKTAAAVRFNAITAVATLLRRRLVAAGDLLELVNAGQLLPLLVQCCDEDWYADVRHTAVYVVGQLLACCGVELGDEARRAIYPELVKRLDDSSDQVRVAACGALVAFVTAAGASYCPTNSGYLAAGVAVHMDDTNPAVQEAACGVLLAQAAQQPGVVVRELRKVAGQFRAQHYVQRVLTAAGEVADQ